MDSKRWQKIENIVDTALTLSEEKRTDYIEQECAGDLELKSSVTDLLESIEASEGYLEDPQYLQNDLLSNFAIEDEKASSMIGEKIGSYKLVELIGHGGMGSIFVAERVDGDFDQKVALKLIRRGMDTPSNIARFKRERSILANLNHPNIAQLYDGGLTEDRLPYLVMEYVNGTSIDQYCEEKDLSILERIELYKAVCKAVRYAHNNLIIHRDLKPENILVKENGEVKILDFGIAKLLEPDNEHTFQTQTGSRVLTLGYAAPEQLSGESVTVNTDIYALGVLLYELLADVHPFDFKDKNIQEIETIIRKEIPQKPSSRDKSSKILKGDLDAIVMKAMRKEASGRYNSAGELLEDLMRYENGLPVLAHEGSTTYWIKKFINRNKKSIAAGLFFLLSITGLTGFYTYQLAQERNQAQFEAKKAQEVTNFLTSLFEANAPEKNLGDTLTAATLLQSGLDKINNLEAQPEVQTEMMMVLSDVYYSLGRYEKAKSILKKALKIRRSIFNNDDTNIAETLWGLAVIENKLGNFKRAEVNYRKALTIYDKETNPEEVAEISGDLAMTLESTGKTELAISLYQKSLNYYDSKSKKDSSTISIIGRNLGTLLAKQGKSGEALSLIKQSYKIDKELYGESHIKTAISANDLATIYMDQEEYNRALPLFDQALKIKKKVYGTKHPDLAATLNNLAVLYERKGKYTKAESLYTETLDIAYANFNETHPAISATLSNVANLNNRIGNFEKAESIYEKVLSLDKEIFGTQHRYVASDLKKLAVLSYRRGDNDDAEKKFVRSLKISRKVLPDTHPDLLDLLVKYGKFLLDQEKLNGSKKILVEAVDKMNQKPEQYRKELIRANTHLGNCLIKQNQFEVAEEVLLEASKLLEGYAEATTSQKKRVKSAMGSLYKVWQAE